VALGGYPSSLATEYLLHALQQRGVLDGTGPIQLSRYRLKKGSKTTNWLRATGGTAGEPYGLEADAFTKDAIRSAFVEEAAPYLQEIDPTAALLALLEEAARRRQAALPLADVVARLAQLPTGDLPALTRHLQARLAPELEYPDAGLAEGIMQLQVAELLELARRVRERRAQGV
jgi:hypothetical protein